MRRAFILPLCAGVLALGCIPVFSQSRFTPKTVGEWRVYEDLGHSDPPITPAKGIPNAASTHALDGRRASLGISSCGPFAVSFSIEVDSKFNGPKNPEDEFKVIETRVVYSKVFPSERKLMPLVLEAGDEEYFTGDADTLARGTKFMVCPSQDEGPRCLNFSLRGITAALKAVCPKR